MKCGAVEPAAMPPALNSSWWLLPQQVREVAEVIGIRAAMHLVGAICPQLDGKRGCQGRGRVGIAYCPQNPNGVAFDRLVGIVGDDAARALVRRFGGSDIRMQACTAFNNQVRDASVRDYWRNSKLSAAWIGWLHDITERQVRNLTRGESRPAVAANGGRTTGTRTPTQDLEI